jgi:hypothetical protein
VSARLVSILAVLVIALAGCVVADEDPSPGAQSGSIQDATVALCQRLEECNLLTGISVDECIDHVGGCLDDIGERPQRQWQPAVDACLAEELCQDFSECYAAVPYC